ncbi:FadR/GntR family transcriptional regulator [Pectinatus cerevisiiphilus]|uniref:DNA-binding FadR family transcriptional regulator n=1 Tax=Pectinatus cerevisiiphilus TaxID=86956 RepID=A0A4V2US52_9FIRM|nr:FadR/GntR family transcriptional regulator [Pectinatus cerevisiiphilus]TCS80122.1 DNA-binding FadR family transcriptional regulator [Pectinatus cerevisiiphilus]
MRPSLVNITINNILDLLKDKNMQPGDKLPTVDSLSAKFKVGHSTVREALKALSAQNLLIIRQGAGTFVSQKQGISNDPLGLGIMGDDISTIFDMITVRLIFEPEIAAMAAQKATLKNLKHINELCLEVEKLIKAGENYDDEDSLFHSAIANASGNKIIYKITQIIHSSIKKNIFVTDNSLCKETITAHRQIAKAIAIGDSAGAKNGMILHLNAQREFLLKNYDLQV